MKTHSIWGLILIFNLVQCTETSHIKTNKIYSKISSEKILIFLKSDVSKTSQTLKSYSNLKNASHVGFLLKRSNSFEVIQIHPNYITMNGEIVVTELKDYLKKENESLSYFSVWKLNNLDNNYVETVINDYLEREVHFDMNFDLTTDRELYCSEFIYKVLNYTSEKYKQNPVKIKKPEFLSYLQNDSLEYYPVDFFLNYEDIELIYKLKSI